MQLPTVLTVVFNQHRQSLHADHKTRLKAARETVMTETKAKMADFLSDEQIQKVSERIQHRKSRIQKGMKKMKHKRGHRMNNKEQNEPS